MSRKFNNFKHGKSNSPEYRAWSHMKERCYNPNDKMFADYGGRGIVVCEQWQERFEVFYNDMGPRPSAKHSLDRFPDMNGNYKPGNCRWATRKQQNGNTRKNIILTHEGVSKVISDWAKELGVNYGSIQYQLKKRSFAEIIEYYKAGNKNKKPSGKNCHFYGLRGVDSPAYGRKPKTQKLILDTQTGIFYDCCKDAAAAKGYNEGTLYAKLVGKIKNNSGLIYA